MGKLLRSNSIHSISNASLYTHNWIMNCTTVVFIVSMYSSRDPEYNIKLTNCFKDKPTFISTDCFENIN